MVEGNFICWNPWTCSLLDKSVITIGMRRSDDVMSDIMTDTMSKEVMIDVIRDVMSEMMPVSQPVHIGGGHVARLRLH